MTFEVENEFVEAKRNDVEELASVLKETKARRGRYRQNE
jgi:hypothetical protein